MKITKSKAVILLYCAYIADCVFSESHLIDYQFLDILFTFVRYGIFFALLALCISNSSVLLNKRIIIPIFVIMLSTLINSVFFKGGTSLVFILVICATFKKFSIRSDRIFNDTLNTLILTNVIVVLLSLAGILDDTVGYRTLGTELGRYFQGYYERHSYGFLTANQIPFTLFITYVLRITYKREKMRTIEHLIFAVLNVLFLQLFNSRAAFILLAVAIVSYFAAKYLFKRSLNKGINGGSFVWIIYPVCAIGSIVLSIFYNSNSTLWRYINNVFMNRIIMSNQALNKYGITLFGNGISASYTWSDYSSEITTSTLDNGYVNLLIQRGIIIFIFVLFIWCTLIYKAQKKGNIYLLFGLITLAIANIIDAHLISYRVIPFYCLFVETNSELLTTKNNMMINRIKHLSVRIHRG